MLGGGFSSTSKPMHVAIDQLETEVIEHEDFHEAVFHADSP